ncbi:MAG: cobalamin B12-binding domain-containing protein, partial [bacterium]
MSKNKLILAASIGKCVHVAGVLNFLRLAEEYGYKTKFLGPAVNIRYLLDAVEETNPCMVAVGYRLTAEAGYRILKNLKNAVFERGLESTKFIFGGTLPVARKAEEVGLFDVVFNGEEELSEIIAFLEGRNYKESGHAYEDNLISRMESKKPYPLIRHHFGLPSIKETVSGIT